MPNYTLPDGETVKNKLGARSHDELETLEVGPAVARHTEHLLDPRIPRTFDTAHLKALTRQLFQDVYECLTAALNQRPLPAAPSVKFLLGHTKLESTVRYLGIEVDDALAIAEQTDI